MRTTLLLCLLWSLPSLAQTNNPKALISEDLQQWYSLQTGHTVDDSFGIARLELYKDELIIGMARRQQGPVDEDGAMVASLSLLDNSLTKMGYLFEQGFHDMEIINGVLHVPGTDPRFRPDTDPVGEPAQPIFYWNLGNWYRFDLTKSPRKRELLRNLPFVVHGWGQWFDPSTQTIYHATSRVTCPTPTVNGDCYEQPGAVGGGSLFKTTDFGDTWELIADREQGIGNFRTYDVQGVDQALFATWGDRLVEGTQSCGIARQKANETQWERVVQLRVPCKVRLQAFKSALITINEYGTRGIMVHPENDITTPYDGTIQGHKPYRSFRLPDRTVRNPLNAFKVSADGSTLFFAGAKGIYSTTDLFDWVHYTESSFLGDTKDFVVDSQKGLIYQAGRTQILEINMSQNSPVEFNN